MSNRKLIVERKQKAKRIFAVVLMIIFLSIPVAVLAAGYYEIWYDSKPLNNEEEYYISYCDIATDNVQLYEGDRVYMNDYIIYDPYDCDGEVIDSNFRLVFYEDGAVAWSDWGGYSYQLINELTFRKSYINDDGIPVLEFDYYYEPVDNALEGKLLEVGDQIRTDVSSDKLISLAIDTKETNPKCSYPIRYYNSWYQYEMLGIEKEEGDGWDYGSDNYTIVGYDNESPNHNIVLGWKMIDREQWSSSAGYNLYIELEAVCGNSIVYILDGGENDASNPSTYETNEGVSSFAPARKSGMRFMGWFADDSYTEEISYIEVGTEGPVYLYAKYESEEPDPNSSGESGMNDPTADPSDNNSSFPITPQTKDDLLSMVTIIAICLCGAVLILVVYKIKMR